MNALDMDGCTQKKNLGALSPGDLNAANGPDLIWNKAQILIPFVGLDFHIGLMDWTKIHV